MTLLERLRQAGADTCGAVRRFAGNEGLYLKFALKFTDDLTFSQIGPALERGDWEEALRAAHTLKGVSGNLGFTELFHECDLMVRALRAGDHCGAADAYAPLERAYRQILAALEGGRECEA